MSVLIRTTSDRFAGLPTRQDAATTRAVNDLTSRVDAECRRVQAVITDAVLTIVQLAHWTGGTSGGSQVKAAAISAADEGVGARRESHEREEALHGGKRMRGRA